MIICSCKVLSDKNIKECLKDKDKKPSVSAVLRELGCDDNVCGSCVKNVVKTIKSHYGK